MAMRETFLCVILLGAIAACGRSREQAPAPGAAPSRAGAASPAAAAGAGGNPFRGATLFVDPGSPARAQAAEWKASRAQDAALIESIASQPQADWYGAWTADPKAEVDARVGEITAAGALPVLVAQVGPACGGPEGEPYLGWMRGFAEGIGDRRAVVVLEPDALRGVEDCKTDADRQKRLGLIAQAVETLAARPGTAVYVAAGGSAIAPADVIAERLKQAGIARARGFAVNVASFGAAADEVEYGKQVSRLVGDKPFVIDTSRGGRGPAGSEWCNPRGRGLGPRPTADTGEPLVDAYLWIKRPGTSDGTCNAGPPPGQWWPEGALELARNAER